MVLDRHHMLSLHNVLEGLRLGLCEFSGPSRVALIYGQKPGESLRVVDSQNLLQGHEPRLREYFLDTDEWCEGLPDPEHVTYFDQAKAKRIGLAGMVSLGGRSPGVSYQMWLTDRHVDLCSPGPTRRWLELALLQFSQNLAAQDLFALDSAAHMLQEMAPHAVHDFLVDERSQIIGPDTRLRVYNILASIMQISKTPEEGAWARGHLAFVEPSRVSRLHYLIRFPKAERPRLDNSKHVRKMLQSVERSKRLLVSDGEHILGIAAGELPPSSLCALFRSVSRTVSAAGEQKYGCAIIVDPYTPLLPVSGHNLETPLDLDEDEHLVLAAALAKVDGALHLSAARNQLCGFACLMDGPSFPGEDRSRGARYNSALRFTYSHPELMVVVVSSDRPVSVMQKGADLSRPPVWPAVPSLLHPPQTLEQWLNGGKS